MNPRTDIAFEEIELLQENESFKNERKVYRSVIMNHVKILKEDTRLNKDIGDYITIDIPKLTDHQEREDTSEVVKEAIIQLLPKNNKKVLIVGLGNEEVTADALGPLVASEIVVTSHLFRMKQNEMTEGCRDVSVIVPRVMGQTGIETAVLVKAIVNEIKPDVVIAVDALATSSIERINRVIQITNTGIRPGAGVGNHRLAINESSLGVPVLAIGVATVVSVGALVSEVLQAIKSQDLKQAEQYIENSECYKMVVTPKEMDEDVHHLVKILGKGLNQALHLRFDQL